MSKKTIFRQGESPMKIIQPRKSVEIQTDPLDIEGMAKQFRRKMTFKFSEMMLQSMFTDLKILCCSHIFNTHKVILAASSDFFYSLFIRKDKTNIKRLALHDLDPKTLECLINYMYKGILPEMDLTPRLEKSMTYLNMSDVCEYRINLLLKNLSSNNFYRLWNIAKTYDLKGMEERIATYTAKHLDSCIRNEKFVHMSLDQIKNVSTQMNIIGESEANKTKAIFHWILHDYKKREVYTIILLSASNISHIFQEQISQLQGENQPECSSTLNPYLKVDNDGYFTSFDHCQELNEISDINVEKSYVQSEGKHTPEKELYEDFCMLNQSLRSTSVMTPYMSDDLDFLDVVSNTVESTIEQKITPINDSDHDSSNPKALQSDKNDIIFLNTIEKLLLSHKLPRSRTTDGNEDNPSVLLASGISPGYWNLIRNKYRCKKESK